MIDERVRRKLRAILSADAVGYSRLMEENEVSTIRTIEESKALMADLIQQHSGRVVDAPGDNLLAEFGSVVDATDCAVKIQQAINSKNAVLPDNRKMEFRIGVNLGDVVEEADRIYGDGVNIAARIEGLAKPGRVCISGTAYDHVKSKLELGYEYLGEHSVKNIAEPVRVYRVLTEPQAIGKVTGEKRFLSRFSRRSAISLIIVLIIVVAGLITWNIYLQQSKKVEPASLDKMAYPLPEKPSIAVLPFDNLSGNPEQEYFSDGITEEIITALSKVPKLFVIARNSTFTYKGKPVKVQQVSEELGVQYVLEGSVRRVGDRVRIAAQLIDALTGLHIWAEKYDRDINDIFVVQDEITKKIITALQVKLTEGEQARFYAKGTDNLEAYLKVMEANWHYSQISKEGVLKAKQLAEEAIALDPGYAFAYKILGSTHGIAMQLGMSKNPRESLKRAIGLFRKAIELDDSSAMAHNSLGFWSMYVRQYDTAAVEGKRALELEPNSADVIAGYASIVTILGKPEEAISFFKEALRLNPKPPSYYFHFFGIALRDSGQYEKAVIQARKAIEQEPNNLIANVVLTSSLSLAGKEDKARIAAKEILRISPKFSVERWEKVSPHKDRAVVKRYCNALRKAGLPE
jgi:adenylate cyclase